MTHDYENLYYSTPGPNQYRVYYQPGQDGGGTWFGQEYVGIIKERYPDRQFNRAFEWCSGPGFIGMSLLDHGLVEHCVFADVHKPCIQQLWTTAQDGYNQVGANMFVYHAGAISELPDHEVFDLIVGNPPHFPVASDNKEVTRVECDVEWDIHKEFFRNISQHMNQDSVILLQENHDGSSADLFRPWIEENGLMITDWFESPQWWHYPDSHTQIYYIEIKSAV